MNDETTATPEPGGETEIEIAAAGGGVGEDDGGSVGSGESDQLRSAAVKLRLGGILQSTTRPGSSLSSRINSGCSTPNSTPVYRPEALQYPCTNFVHSSPVNSDLGLEEEQVTLLERVNQLLISHESDSRVSVVCPIIHLSVTLV